MERLAEEVYQGFIELNPSSNWLAPSCVGSLSGIYRTEPQQKYLDNQEQEKSIRDLSN